MIVTFEKFEDEDYKEFLKSFDFNDYDFGEYDSYIADGAVHDIYCVYLRSYISIDISGNGAVRIDAECFLYVHLDEDKTYSRDDIMKLVRDKTETTLIITNRF